MAHYSAQYPPLLIQDLDIWRPGNARPTLVNIDFALGAGTVTALVGPSGAGKSTLFAAIQNQISVHKGTVFINGHPNSSRSAVDPSLVSFVPQKTTLRPGLTVFQTVELAAFVRSGRGVRRSELKEQIRSILDDLELTGVSDNLVENLSGGQELRVSIALELVSEPRLLILDEPTSGLDESTSRKLLETLRRIANRSSSPAILFSTHRNADLNPANVDAVVALGNATDNTAEKSITSATVRYVGPLRDFFATFGVDDLGGVNDVLKAPPPRPARIPTAAPKSAYLFNSKTLSWARSFAYHWRIQRIGLGDWKWVAQASKTMLMGITLAMVLHWVSDLGLAPDTQFGNHKFLVYTGLLILSLVAWGSQLPVMKLVESWIIVRREQTWGVSAKAFVWSLISRQLAELMLAVVTVVGVALLLAKAPTENTLLPRFGDYDTFIQLTVVLFLAKFLAYCFGILIGCLNVSPVKALGQTVVLSLVMLFGSGLLFKLPEFRPVYLVTFVLPSRSGIAAIASNFDAKSAMGVVTDEAFDLDLDRLYLLLVCMVAVAMICLLISMMSIPKTLRRAHSSDEEGMLTKLWNGFTSYRATRWMRSNKAAPLAVVATMVLVMMVASIGNVEGDAAGNVLQATPSQQMQGTQQPPPTQAEQMPPTPMPTQNPPPPQTDVPITSSGDQAPVQPSGEIVESETPPEVISADAESQPVAPAETTRYQPGCRYTWAQGSWNEHSCGVGIDATAIDSSLGLLREPIADGCTYYFDGTEFYRDTHVTCEQSYRWNPIAATTPKGQGVLAGLWAS